MTYKMTKKSLLAAMAISTALATPGFSAYAQDQDSATNDDDDMETIVVSGARREKLLKDVTGSVSVMTSVELEEQVVSDMSQLFKYDPSVQITGDVGGPQNIIVRGMGGDRVLMIKDGMRMNEGYGANGLNDVVGRGFIETDMLKQVEVAKGAGSSLYGSDALGGIVVFTTKDASDFLDDGDTFGGRARVGYTDLSDQYNVGATFALDLGVIEQVINASYREGHEQQNINNSKIPQDIDSLSIFYKAKAHLSDDSFLSFTVDYWDQDVSGDHAFFLSPWRTLGYLGFHIVDESLNSEKRNNSYKLTFQTEGETAVYDYLNMSVYLNKTRQTDVEFGALEIDSFYSSDTWRDMTQSSNYTQESKGLLTSFAKDLNNHTIGYGFDYEETESLRSVYEFRESNNGVTKDSTHDKFPTNTIKRTGIFLNDEIRIADGSFVVTPGLRFDHYKMDPGGALTTKGEPYETITKSNLSLNLGALYHITDNASVYAQYGQGFKAPAYDLAYIEHYNSQFTYIYEIVPGEDLRPEKSDTYEVGYRGKVGEFNVSAAAYYNDYTDFLTIANLTSEPFVIFGLPGLHETFQYQNLESVTIKGLEFGFSGPINDNFSVFANAAWQTGKNGLTDEYITSINPLQGSMGVSWHSDSLTSSLNMKWASSMSKVPTGALEGEGYAVFDLMVGYEITESMKLNIAVYNLFDKEYVRYNRIAGRAPGIDLASLAEAGRAFFGNVAFSF